MQFVRRVAHAVSIVAVLVAPPYASGQDDLMPVMDAREYAGVTTSPELRDGFVVFSRYAADGTDEEIVAVDPFDGSADTLAVPARQARYIAADSRYVVYSTAGSSARPVVVADRGTGQPLASIRLRDAIMWGHIRGDRLILIQGGQRRSPVLVYRLPELTLDRSTEIAAVNTAQLWGDRIVAVGSQLSLYDLDLGLVAAVDLPSSYPDINAGCTPAPLRIYRDLAILGSRCFQIAVYDLPTLGLRYTLRGFANYHGFDAIDGLLFVSGYDGVAPHLRVYDIATSRETARLSAAGYVYAAKNGRLLMMQREGFPSTDRATVHAPVIDYIRSDSARLARVLDRCQATDVHLHAAIDSCEQAGIRAYLDTGVRAPELTAAVGNYAGWLALSYSRFGEALPILETLNDYPNRDRLLALARVKAGQMGVTDSTRAATDPDSLGVTRNPIDFGAFSNLIAFDGSRAYVARWACSDYTNTPTALGVTLDVLNRETFTLRKRIDVAGCDPDYQDAISSVHILAGYIVLGLTYRYDADRPNVAVIDSSSLEVLASNHIAQQPGEFREWSGRLLRCATHLNEPHMRFDPVTASLVEAADEEALACLSAAGSSPSRAQSGVARPSQNAPLFSTPRYAAYDGSTAWPMRTYRFVGTAAGQPPVETTPRQYVHILGVPDQDAAVLGYQRGDEWFYARFDIDTRAETTLFATKRAANAAAVWRNYLFIAMERDLLSYDLVSNRVVYFERDFIREGRRPVCAACADGNGIRNLLFDGDRLIVIPLRGWNARVIDLAAYVANFRGGDFFVDLVERAPADAGL
jgi:hypothetical protein